MMFEYIIEQSIYIREVSCFFGSIIYDFLYIDDIIDIMELSSIISSNKRNFSFTDISQQKRYNRHIHEIWCGSLVTKLPQPVYKK